MLQRIIPAKPMVVKAVSNHGISKLKRTFSHPPTSKLEIICTILKFIIII